MADLPAHPDQNDHAEIAAASSRPGWKSLVGIALIVALVVLVVVLHLTGVIGPESHA